MAANIRREPALRRIGTSEGYDVEHRIDALRAYAIGRENLVTPSVRSMRRWVTNGTQRKRKRGGQAATILRGEHEFLLIFFRVMIAPMATADEVIAFIAQNSSDNMLFDRPQISKCEKRLKLTRKRGSITALQAMTPANLHRRHAFWTQPYPVGRLGTPPADLIDIDEFGIWIEKLNRHYGKAPTNVRVNEVGPYGHGEKWTCIFAISPCGRRWYRFRKVAGTSAEDYNDFVENEILTGPAAIPAAPVRTLMHDNLTAHHSNLVINSVRRSGHRLLFRPPYRPVDGPIEYAIGTVEAKLRNKIHLLVDDNALIHQMQIIMTNIGPNGFQEYFAHCGY